MTGSVTKATPIQFINGNNCIKKYRGRKTVLSGYYACLSHDLLLMALGHGADTHTYTRHTHTYTKVHGRNDFKKPGTREPVAHCAPDLKLFKMAGISSSYLLKSASTK